MPIHDWNRAPDGLFHHFHQRWTGELCDALNSGLLPKGYFALVDIRTAGVVPDVLTLKRAKRPAPTSEGSGGVAIAVAPPKARFVSRQSDREIYARRANRVAVRGSRSELVAVIEILSPGNKESRAALRSFVAKAVELLTNGVNLLIVDLFPPTPRDPQGIHKAVWDEFREEPFQLPSDKPLTIAAYSAEATTAYVEPVAVGDLLPSLPVFLDPLTYIPAPLEASYRATWDKCPAEFREDVESGGGESGDETPLP